MHPCAAVDGTTEAPRRVHCQRVRGATWAGRVTWRRNGCFPVEPFLGRDELDGRIGLVKPAPQHVLGGFF